MIKKKYIRTSGYQQAEHQSIRISGILGFADTLC